MSLGRLLRSTIWALNNCSMTDASRGTHPAFGLTPSPRPIGTIPFRALRKNRTTTSWLRNTVPEGDHRVLGERPQTLPVGRYPVRRRGRDGRGRVLGATLSDAVVAEFHTMEEKGSDVNLAAHLLNDAWKDLFEAAVVISNDTDLVVAIRMVTEERKRPVFVACPGRWQVAPQLREVASHVRHIRPGMLRAAQFPNTLSGTGIVSRRAGRQESGKVERDA